MQLFLSTYWPLGNQADPQSSFQWLSRLQYSGSWRPFCIDRETVSDELGKKRIKRREHHDRLASDFERAQEYHDTARELASEAKDRNPQFSDKERINLEIYAEHQNDTAERERYLEMARGEAGSHEREISISPSR